MKKLLILLGLAAVLLAGCGNGDAEETKKESEPATVPPMSIPAGKAEAVEPLPEDIVIPINP